jgi:hypothetical protein
MTHPGLLMARMVAATPKQIAMARQMVNSESHILHPPNSLSYLSCVSAACSASVSQRGRAPRSARPMPTAPASQRNSIWSVIVPADGTSCHCMETETSVRLRFLGSSPTSRLLA